MSGVQHIEIAEGDSDQRLDRFLKRQFPQLTQGMIEKMCRKGELRLDGGRVKSNTRVEAGQSLRVPPLPDQKAKPKSAPKASATMSDQDAKMMQSLVLYRDADLLVLNKPAGLAVQGGSKTTRHIDGLAEALKFGNDEKPHLVHRLDRDTSGVLLMARHRKAAAKLTRLFQSRHMEKVYWALVAGAPSRKTGRINYGLVKAKGHGKSGEGEKMQIVHPNRIDEVDGAKHAVSDFMVMEAAGSRMAWLAMSPLTGRTHQLRAHADALGHPIIGDGKYGGSGAENKGDGWGAGVGGAISRKLHLHARSLRFRHPFQERDFFIAAPLPKHMKRSWELMGWGEDREYDMRWEEAREGMK